MPKKSTKKRSVSRSKLTDKQMLLDAEMFEDSDIDETNNPIYKKGKLLAIFGLLLALFLILYLVFAPVSHSVYGKLISPSLDKNQLTFGDTTIYFPDNVAKDLSFVFQSKNKSRKVETSVCLRGLVDSGTYSIDEVFYPLITYQSYTEVSFKACPDNTLIMLQIHPFGDCVASRTDLNILRKRQKINGNVLMLVMCKDNNYVIYS